MSRAATVYPVEIIKTMTDSFGKDSSKSYTTYVKANKSAITKKLKSLGIKNYRINNPVSKALLSKVNAVSISGLKQPPARFTGAGKLPGGVNNPGMKISEDASATKGTKKQKIVTKRGGSGNQNVSLSKFKEKLKSKEIKKPKPLTADKKESIVNKVKKKNKNVPKSRILGWIKNNPVKAAAGGAGIVGIIIGALGYALTSTPAGEGSTLGVTTSSKTQKRPKGGLRKGKKTTLVKKKTVPLGPNRPKSTVKKSDTPKTTKKPVDPKVQKATPSTFGEAFKQARKEGKKSFTFKGKSYAAVTMDEVKKKGHKTLQSYLNAKGKPKKLKKDIKER
tara:strand:- start:470 stop:1471 length:1002 start_codon:yes stop_codon:yes gene_type:complete